MHNTTGWNRTNLVSRVEEVYALSVCVCVCVCVCVRERESRKAGSPWLLEPICMRRPRMKKKEKKRTNERGKEEEEEEKEIEARGTTFQLGPG